MVKVIMSWSRSSCRGQGHRVMVKVIMSWSRSSCQGQGHQILSARGLPSTGRQSCVGVSDNGRLCVF